MSSVCISNCVKDAIDPRMPVRSTYVNLCKWSESDVEFMKSVHRVGQGFGHPRVVSGISCRQLYLRSYRFSRKESVSERTKKCVGRVKEKVANHGRKRKEKGRRRKCLVFRKVKEISRCALFRFFYRLCRVLIV
ncbi:hypothetical protein K2173_019611 [Erythroxylum novogranatense]|uniref:Uncharacterized protein n=1 Tax=Erythroxylum novogranatense TaxID=1862640 RepID=A0AAV8UF15_9ROSI|nr:hypothetical protein K2173_019611 [Erythroxylum novogranatense]